MDGDTDAAPDCIGRSVGLLGPFAGRPVCRARERSRGGHTRAAGEPRSGTGWGLPAREGRLVALRAWGWVRGSDSRARRPHISGGMQVFLRKPKVWPPATGHLPPSKKAFLAWGRVIVSASRGALASWQIGTLTAARKSAIHCHSSTAAVGRPFSFQRQYDEPTGKPGRIGYAPIDRLKPA